MTSKAELRDEIFDLKQEVRAFKLQVEQLLDANGVLERWRRDWLHGYNERDQISLQTTHGAFSALLEQLGVEHMTAAVMRIEELVKLEKETPTRLELAQQKSTAEGAIRIHQLAIKQLEFQRDSAQAREFDTSFERDNLKARCEELEELLGEIRLGNLHSGWQLGIAIPGKIDAMLGPVVGADK